MINYFSSGGVSTYMNPLDRDGQLIHAVNMVSFPYGAKSKRPGYTAFLGTPDSAQVQSLIAFPNVNNDATKLNLFRASGTIVYHSLQGTGPWTISGNGTISNGVHFGAVVSNGGTVLIGGDGVGSTRHTTNGTSFTNTTLAPTSEFWEDYQGRAFAGGTNNNLFYSTANDATNWNTSGTSDSSSFRVPGEGKLQKIFKVADRLTSTKNKGAMFQWDGYQQVDMATTFGPSSPYSVAESEGYRFYINQYGHFGFNGAKPQLLSNAVQRYFYNQNNTGIAGTLFPTIPAVCHFYDYFAAIGTVTDDFTRRQIGNAILNYNYQRNEYLVWQFVNNPTSFLSYTDVDGKRQLIFGDASGQCYQLDNTKTTDNGIAIPTELVYLFTYGKDAAAYEKKWNWLRLFFNPGCEVNIQVAFANTFTYESLQWRDITDYSPNPNSVTSDGVFEARFSQDTRSRLMFLRIYESSPNSRWTYYGSSIDAEVIEIR